jgi:hypothetical protein
MGGFHGRSAYEARYDRRDQPVQLTGLLFVALSVKGTALSESAALRSRAVLDLGDGQELSPNVHHARN